MKELTIEQKAKRYDEALEIAKTLYCADDVNCMDLETIFPELAESEDEKIREEIVEYISNELHPMPLLAPNTTRIKDWIAWLEKQGEHANKVVPKFQNGQWIVWQNKCYKVNYNGCGYELIDQNGLSTSLEYGTVNVSARLYDVTKDAKDGDVLISQYNKPFIYNGNYNSFHIGSYCGISTESRFNVATEKCHWTENINIHPATKEQRDTLFVKMKEEGYEWDDEKKELKKIEDEEYDGEDYGIDGLWHAQKILEKTLGKVDGYQTDDGILDHKVAIDAVKKLYKQKPIWSEEDETNLTNTIIMLKEGASHHFTNFSIIPCVDWLKQLKQRMGG